MDDDGRNRAFWEDEANRLSSRPTFRQGMWIGLLFATVSVIVVVALLGR